MRDHLDAPQRGTAVRWLEDAFVDPAGIGFTWQALTGFLRLVTQPRIIPTPLPSDTAPRVVDQWLSHPRARTVEPTDRHAALLARLLIGAGRAGNLVGSRPAA